MNVLEKSDLQVKVKLDNPIIIGTVYDNDSNLGNLSIYPTNIKMDQILLSNLDRSNYLVTWQLNKTGFKKLTEYNNEIVNVEEDVRFDNLIELPEFEQIHTTYDSQPVSFIRQSTPLRFKGGGLTGKQLKTLFDYAHSDDTGEITSFVSSEEGKREVSITKLSFGTTHVTPTMHVLGYSSEHFETDGNDFIENSDVSTIVNNHPSLLTTGTTVTQVTLEVRNPLTHTPSTFTVDVIQRSLHNPYDEAKFLMKNIHNYATARVDNILEDGRIDPSKPLNYILVLDKDRMIADTSEWALNVLFNDFGYVELEMYIVNHQNYRYKLRYLKVRDLVDKGNTYELQVSDWSNYGDSIDVLKRTVKSDSKPELGLSVYNESEYKLVNFVNNPSLYEYFQSIADDE